MRNISSNSTSLQYSGEVVTKIIQDNAVICRKSHNAARYPLFRLLLEALAGKTVREITPGMICFYTASEADTSTNKQKLTPEVLKRNWQDGFTGEYDRILEQASDFTVYSTTPEYIIDEINGKASIKFSFMVPYTKIFNQNLYAVALYPMNANYHKISDALAYHVYSNEDDQDFAYISVDTTNRNQKRIAVEWVLSLQDNGKNNYTQTTSNK